MEFDFNLILDVLESIKKLLSVLIVLNIANIFRDMFKRR